MPTRQRAFIVEILTALGLIAAPFVLPHLGFTPTTINRILIMGLVGIGFDLLFGFTGLLSFGQAAFFGTGGMVAAWLLTQAPFGNTVAAALVGMVAAGIVGCLIGLLALRRTGIYFAMITVAIAEVFFFLEFNPLSAYTGGENGLPGVPPPNLNLGFASFTFDSNWAMYGVFAFWYFVGLVIALRIVRSPVGVLLRAIRDNPLRAQALGHDIHGYKLTVFVVAAMYSGFAGVWLYLSDFFQTTLNLGATWKRVLGVVFVVLVVFLRHGLVGAIVALWRQARPARAAAKPPAEPAPAVASTPAPGKAVATPLPRRR